MKTYDDFLKEFQEAVTELEQALEFENKTRDQVNSLLGEAVKNTWIAKAKLDIAEANLKRGVVV